MCVRVCVYTYKYVLMKMGGERKRIYMVENKRGNVKEYKNEVEESKRRENRYLHIPLYIYSGLEYHFHFRVWIAAERRGKWEEKKGGRGCVPLSNYIRTQLIAACICIV